jgi:hypothetical protein
MNRDDSVTQLVLLLDSVFEFLTQGSQLEAIAKLTSDKVPSDTRLGVQIQILVLLSQQVTECAHFIYDYAKDTNYCASIELFTLIEWLSIYSHIRETSNQTFNFRSR